MTEQWIERWDPQPFEEPPWLQARIDQLLARFDEVGAIEKARDGGFEIIMTTLTEPVDASDAKRWERACDNCNAHTPVGILFYSGHVFREVRAQKLLITFGVCADCKP